MRRGHASPVVILLALAGCSKPVPPSCDGGTERAGGSASVIYVACQGRPLVVAWTDISFDAPNFVFSARSSRGPGRAEDNFTIGSPDGRGLELKAVTADGTAWVVTLNGQEYRLEEGAVFLVRTDGGSTRVTQVKRDLSGLPAAPKWWERVAEETPEVKAFLAQVGGKE